jgi:hypothetical protein
MREYVHTLWELLESFPISSSFTAVSISATIADIPRCQGEVCRILWLVHHKDHFTAIECEILKPLDWLRAHAESGKHLRDASMPAANCTPPDFRTEKAPSSSPPLDASIPLNLVVVLRGLIHRRPCKNIDRFDWLSNTTATDNTLICCMMRSRDVASGTNEALT